MQIIYRERVSENTPNMKGVKNGTFTIWKGITIQ